MRVVIPSVNYGDHLAHTLPAWNAICPAGSITVVTAPTDHETQRVAVAAGARVIVTDAWTRHDKSYQPPKHWEGLWTQRRGRDRSFVLNKALALDEAFGFAGLRFTPTPDEGELCLAVDADCLPVGQLPAAGQLESGVLYGCRRYDGNPDGSRGAEIVLKGRIRQSQHATAIAVGGGYFQLFRYATGRRFGSYPAADGYDYDFAFTWPRGVVLECIHVLHFGETHRNWEGRVTPRWEGAQP